MALDNKIRITDLEFETIKSGLVDYLRTQPEFTDYNFEASGLSTLINLLAYNSHYQGLMANFVANELFMDTAVKRNSVVSRAKELGYVPYSRRAPVAVIDLVVSNVTGNPSSLILPLGTRFSTQVNDTEYIFTTTVSYSANNSNNTYTFSGVKIYEGDLLQNTVVFNQLSPILTIPNANIDISTFKMSVRESLNEGYVEFSRAISFLDVKGDTKVYFFQENYDNNFGVYFGDNVIGHTPAANSDIVMTYIVTNGAEANDASVFTMVSDIAGFQNSIKTITLVTAAAGGLERETTLSIKHNALNFYGTQNRAVVASDYASLIYQAGVNIQNVITWGGEENVPPYYNSIFFCVQPSIGDILTDSDKEVLTAFFKQKAVGNTVFKFVDPEYIDIAVNTELTYDKNIISISTDSLETAAKVQIESYIDSELSTFGGALYHSVLAKTIDQIDSSVISSETVLSLIKEIIPVLYSSRDISFTMSNPLNTDSISSSVISSGFFEENNSNVLYIEDDRNGNLRTFYYSNNEKIVLNALAGTVNYTTGAVYINPITISETIEDRLYFYIRLKDQNVFASQNVIPRIKSGNIAVSSKAAK